jgi:DNA (cytosine-5)-methyltransferase 1
MIESITFENKKNGEIANLNKGGERGSIYDENTNFMSCLSATDFKQLKQIISFKKIEVGTFRTHKDGNGFRKMKDDNIAPTISARAREDGSGQACIKIHANTKKGFDVMQEGDSLNLTNPKSKTRRGRVGVGVGVAQTLDTLCNQGVLQAQQTDYVIRKLTPLECFRLQDFPDSHVENCRKAGVDDFTQFKKGAISDSQLYKQAGNSITVKVLELNISKFNL